MVGFVENSPALSILDLGRDGWLAAGRRSMDLILTNGFANQAVSLRFDMDRSSGSIDVFTDGVRIQTLNLIRRTDTRGRSRWFFERRGETFQKVYYHNGGFASRKAHGLRYVQECETRADRNLRRLLALEKEQEARELLGEHMGYVQDENGETIDAVAQLRERLFAEFMQKPDRTRISARKRRVGFDRLTEQFRLHHGQKSRVTPRVGEADIANILAANPQIIPESLQYHPRCDDRRATGDAAYLQMNVLKKLGWLRFGELTMAYLGWASPWDSVADRDIDLILDLRTADYARAVLILQRPHQREVQCFPIVALPGDFGRPELRFACPASGCASRFILFDGDRFSVPASPKAKQTPEPATPDPVA